MVRESAAGEWEQIFYGEFDGKRRKRVLIKIIGGRAWRGRPPSAGELLPARDDTVR